MANFKSMQQYIVKRFKIKPSFVLYFKTIPVERIRSTGIMEKLLPFSFEYVFQDSIRESWRQLQPLRSDW
jgi:hypothetical protein